MGMKWKKWKKLSPYERQVIYEFDGVELEYVDPEDPYHDDLCEMWLDVIETMESA
jgi:hypothetical protein